MLKGSKKENAKTKRLEIRLLEEEKKSIKQIAKNNGLSMADLIIQAVKEYNENHSN